MGALRGLGGQAEGQTRLEKCAWALNFAQLAQLPGLLCPPPHACPPTLCRAARSPPRTQLAPQPAAMPTKRGRLVKQLRRMMTESPPENFAPWKEPNNTLKAVIAKSSTGLSDHIAEVQEALFRKYMEKLQRELRHPTSG